MQKVNLFSVDVNVTTTYTFLVDAKNKDEAIDIAEREYLKNSESENEYFKTTQEIVSSVYSARKDKNESA